MAPETRHILASSAAQVANSQSPHQVAHGVSSPCDNWHLSPGVLSLQSHTPVVGSEVPRVSELLWCHHQSRCPGHQATSLGSAHLGCSEEPGFHFGLQALQHLKATLWSRKSLLPSPIHRRSLPAALQIHGQNRLIREKQKFTRMFQSMHAGVPKMSDSRGRAGFCTTLG